MYDSDQFQAGLSFIEFFEEKYSCSGICDEAMFFYTLPLSKGPPASTCLGYMKKAIAHNLTYMGIAGTLAGIIMLITWLGQYMLWKTYDE